MIAWLLAATFLGASGPETAGRLSASDIPAYLDALRSDELAEPPRVEFRDLWNRDAEFRNRRVAVQGRIVHRFSQPPIGRFPALTEYWIVNERGEPFCVVVPSSQGKTNDSTSSVRFRATYLRPIRYESAGGQRVAPLLVASSGPEEIREAKRTSGRFSGEGWVALGLVGLVLIVLLVQFSRRPARRVREIGAKPDFLPDGGEADHVDGN